MGRGRIQTPESPNTATRPSVSRRVAFGFDPDNAVSSRNAATANSATAGFLFFLSAFFCWSSDSRRSVRAGLVHGVVGEVRFVQVRVSGRRRGVRAGRVHDGLA